MLCGAAMGGCLRFSTFACEDDDDCDREDLGVCVVTGSCAYPDGGCPLGLRYDEHADEDLAGTCVDAGTTSSSSTTIDPSTSPTSLETTVTPTTTTVDPTDPTGDSSSESGTDTDAMCGTAGESCCAAGPECESGLTCLGDVCGCVTQVEAGDRHTCAVLVGGGILCWGANDLGQLGDSLNAFEPTPQPALTVLPNDPIREVAAIDHTCVRSEMGNVRCFGNNDAQQVDPGMIAPIADVTIASWIPSADHVSAGISHTCAADGVSLACWGSNGQNQLTGAEPGPGPITYASGLVSALELRGNFGCIIQAGALSCWGQNNQGQLATDPALTPNVATPTAIAVADVADVALGRQHACALTNAGVIQCWGRNDSGQLGDGTGTQQLAPVTVTLPIEAGTPVEIEAGDQHTCVIDDARALWCWGSNANGQLMLAPDGMGFDGYTLVPVAVEAGAGVLAVSGGVTHTCVLTDAGDVRCWGTNTVGQIGNGTTNYAFEPQIADIDCG
jgi:alpha-tubulin suppressor-like RCC1 family protein